MQLRYNVGFRKTDTRRMRLAEERDEKVYRAEYVGSGTFIISKPKRRRSKLRLSRVRKPRRGARK
jgi:hypothetical protein